MPDVHAAMLKQPEKQAPPGTTSIDAMLADAGQMMDYAISRGLLDSGSEGGTETVADIVQAQTAARSGMLTTEIVVAFYTAYSRLAGRVRPVTALSLAASRKASLGGMKALALLLVSGVIVLSIFLFMCNATLTETSDLIDQQNAAALKLWVEVQVMQSGEHAGQVNAANARDGIEVERVFEQMVEFSRRSTWLLESASRLNTWFIPPWLRLNPSNVVFNQANPNGLTHLNVPPDLSTSAEIRAEAIGQIKAYQYIRVYALGLYKINSLIYSSLSAYFLPTVYALLGAFLYGLRLYSRLVTRNEFLPSVANSARYYIASIAGLVVGLFGTLLPKGLGLPPLAVAFLVGYAVEAFFWRLDALIRRFKGIDGPAAAMRAPPPAATSS